MKEVPEINPKTGISRDYLKAFGPLTRYLLSVYGTTTTERIKKWSVDNLVQHQYNFRKYIEWFDPREYVEVVDDKNKDKVGRLDEIVEELNNLVREKTITLGYGDDSYKPRKLYNEVVSLILGVESFDIREVCAKGDAEINNYFWE